MKLLTADEIAEARRDRESRVSWATIAEKLGLGKEALRRQVDPEYRTRRNVYLAARQAVLRVAWRQRRETRASLNAPRPPCCDALAEFLAPTRREPPPGMTLTGWICGDPPPGRSALDRKQHHEAAP